MRRAAVCILALLIALPALAKSLHWSNIDVRARLDADGNLHVVERQTMVFDGDWNGGERVFATRANQKLHVERMVRIDGSTEVRMPRGDLDEVDHWDLSDGNRLRWRARKPDDPPFQNEERTYEIAYRYANVLEPLDGNRYGLRHDFAAEDRPGPIAWFTLRVEFDPVWRAQPVERAQVLRPGETIVLSQELTHHGATPPRSIDHPAPSWIRALIFVALFTAVAFLVHRFFAEERPTGRLAPLDPQLDESIFAIEPEVASAAWYGATEAPAVAALLARMTQEQKIITYVDHGGELHIRRGIAGAQDYEAGLLRKLLFGKRKEVSTAEVRGHYRTKGLDPAAVISKDVDAAVKKLVPNDTTRNRVPWVLDVALLIAAVAGLIATAVTGSDADAAAAGMSALLGVIFGLSACIAAGFNTRAVTRIGWRVVLVCAPLAIPIFDLLADLLVARALGIHTPVLLAIAFWLLAILKFALDLLKTPESPERIALRKRLASAREYFRRQLRTRDPRMSDEWLPWVLAFGLGSNVDRWFRAHGGATNARTTSSSWGSGASSSIGSSSAPSWSGGGGHFGGAGATASFAVAAGAMAQGVSAPSTSSSSGGSSSSFSSSSSSSFSGGGSMGGW